MAASSTYELNVDYERGYRRGYAHGFRAALDALGDKLSSAERAKMDDWFTNKLSKWATEQKIQDAPPPDAPRA